ncbi:tripartite tricarboxylate transporter substrate-binding protein [Salibacterium sp. K-3]
MTIIVSYIILLITSSKSTGNVSDKCGAILTEVASKLNLKYGLVIEFSAATCISDIYEDVPTLKEKGYDIVKESYNGIIAPEGISKEKQEILHDAFKQALEDPKVQEMLESSNQDVSYGDGEEFQEQIEQDMEEDKETLQDMGLIE